MAKINLSDLDVIRNLRDKQLLVELDENMRRKDGIILTICSDGDHSDDWLTHQRKFNKRIHLYAHHGGALILSTSELENPRRILLLKDMRDGVKMKVIRTIALGIHYPCQWARDRGLGIHQQLLMLREACLVTRGLFVNYGHKEFPPGKEILEIVPLLHVFYGNKRREYRVVIDY